MPNVLGTCYTVQSSDNASVVLINIKCHIKVNSMYEFLSGFMDM